MELQRARPQVDLHKRTRDSLSFGLLHARKGQGPTKHASSQLSGKRSLIPSFALLSLPNNVVLSSPLQSGIVIWFNNSIQTWTCPKHTRQGEIRICCTIQCFEMRTAQSQSRFLCFSILKSLRTRHRPRCVDGKHLSDVSDHFPWHVWKQVKTWTVSIKLQSLRVLFESGNLSSLINLLGQCYWR